jgi:spermidine/putrescine transport system substrate-binding protein
MHKSLYLLLALLTPAWAHGDEVLHIYNWNDYLPAASIEQFQAACGCKVVYDTYGANEEMLAKLAAGAKGYDILVPTDYAVTTLINQKALLPLDKSKLPNLSNIQPSFLDRPFDPGNQYSVPYAFGSTLLGFNREKMAELGIPTDSWAALFDPQHLVKIKGKVTALDDPRELIGAALIYLGYSTNDTDAAHWKQAAEVIAKAKPYWAAFNNTSYIRSLATGDIWLAHGYSMDMFQAAEAAAEAGKGVTIGYSIPREGAIMGLDNLVIHKDAPRPDLALRFINFILDGENSAALSNELGVGNPNRAALVHVEPEIASDPALFPDPERLAHMENIQELNAAQRRALFRLWTEIKVK